MSDASSAAISTIARNVRALRSQHGWTLDELAGRSGVSKGMLVQIEQNRTNPSIGTLSRIAEAFGESLAALVELGQSPTVRLVAPDQAVELWHGKPGSVGRLLIGSDRRDHIELWEWRLAAGDEYPGQDHLPGTREMLHVHEGTLTLSVDGVDHQVAAGRGGAVRCRPPARLRQPGSQGGALHHGGLGPARPVQPPRRSRPRRRIGLSRPRRGIGLASVRSRRRRGPRRGRPRTARRVLGDRHLEERRATPGRSCG